MSNIGPFELVFILGALAVWVGLAVFTGRLAERRGRNFWPWFVASVLISWLLVLAILVVLPAKAEDPGAWGVTTGPDSVRSDDA